VSGDQYFPFSQFLTKSVINNYLNYEFSNVSRRRKTKCVLNLTYKTLAERQFGRLSENIEEHCIGFYALVHGLVEDCGHLWAFILAILSQVYFIFYETLVFSGFSFMAEIKG
jgi:hypothetical protein